MAMPLWSDLTYKEFMNASKRTEVAVVITGAVETHGNHLPLGTDCILPSHLGQRIAEKTNALVLPCMPFGDSWSFLPFKGTISIQPENLVRFYADVMSSVFNTGFRFIIALNGHGGNYSSLQQAAKKATEDGERSVIIVNWWRDLGEDARKEVLETEMGHAGEDETSEVMAVCPELVDMESVVSARVKSRFRIVSAIHRDELLPNGMYGEPEKATPEKGKRILEAAEQDLIELIGKLEQGKLPLENT